MALRTLQKKLRETKGKDMREHWLPGALIAFSVGDVDTRFMMCSHVSMQCFSQPCFSNIAQTEVIAHALSSLLTTCIEKYG